MSPRTAKVTMAELKLRRIVENNHRLREELSRQRVLVSLASLSLINYCRETRDPLLPSVWGKPMKGEDPYNPVDEGGCCTIQ